MAQPAFLAVGPISFLRTGADMTTAASPHT
ncbi:MAG: hypothetical protein RL657_60, partial [Pseudomonadota bacterium]